MKLPSSAVEQVFQLAQHRHKSGDLNQAQHDYLQILSAVPNHLGTLINLSLIRISQNQYQQAHSLLYQAFKHDPTNDIVLLNLGLIAQLQHQPTTAIRYYSKLLNVYPTHLAGLVNLGNLLAQSNLPEQAAIYLKKATLLQPTNPDLAMEYHLNQAKLHGPKIAAKALEKIRLLHPQHPNLLINLAFLYQQQGELQHTTDLLLEAERINPNIVELQYNLGSLYQDSKLWIQALSHFSKVLSLNPQFSDTIFRCLFLAKQSTSWTTYNHYQNNYHQLILKLKFQELPFQALVRGQSPQTLFQLISAQHQHLTFFPAPRSTQTLRLKVGFFSSEFSNHATGYLINQTLIALSQSCAIYLLSYGNISPHDYPAPITISDLDNLSNQEIIDQIKSLQLDLLIDLKGHTRNTKVDLTYHGLAPVQCHWLGFPASLSLPSISTFFTDPYITPPASQHHFSETLVWLPHSYQPNSNPPPHTPQKLPNKLKLIVANQPYKITPNLLLLWGKTLSKFSNHTLYLYQPDKSSRQVLQQYWTNHGFNSNQLQFFSHQPHPKHLNSLKSYHLALDTSPINGHTTSSEILSSHVPLITLVTDHLAGRVTASLLISLGLGECITHTPKHYLHLLTHLLTNPHKIKRLRTKLATNIQHYPLFNPQRLSINIYQTFFRLLDSPDSLPAAIRIFDPYPLLHPSKLDSPLANK